MLLQTLMVIAVAAAVSTKGGGAVLLLRSKSKRIQTHDDGTSYSAAVSFSPLFRDDECQCLAVIPVLHHTTPQAVRLVVPARAVGYQSCSALSGHRG